MTDRLQIIKARLAARTRGHWKPFVAITDDLAVIDDEGVKLFDRIASDADWDLIENAPADMEWLIAELERNH